MTSWRDTDPRRVCACGERKSPESAVCQRCHVKRLARRRRLRFRARRWVERWMLGQTIVLEPGDGMDAARFGAALREVIAECTTLPSGSTEY